MGTGGSYYTAHLYTWHWLLKDRKPSLLKLMKEVSIEEGETKSSDVLKSQSCLFRLFLMSEVMVRSTLSSAFSPLLLFMGTYSSF